MKFNKGQTLKNVGSSWFALGVNVPFHPAPPGG